MKPLLGIVTVASLLLCPSAPAQAQAYPRGAINLVIPLAPGDATDTSGRMMAEEMSKLLKVPIIAVNRPGAGGAVGTDSVVKAGKDGQTILFTPNASLTFRRVLDPENVTYDPSRDLTPLGLATRTPSIVAVGPELPYKTFREMVEYSKKNPGKIRVGTVGSGSVGHFSVETINALTGADITMVPFKGAAPAIAALRGGHVEGVALALGAVTGHLRSGAMRGLVMSSKYPGFPDIPTLTDLGYRQNLIGVWFAFFAPAGVSAEVTKTLVPAIEKAVKDPSIAAKLVALGMVQEYLPPERLAAEIRDEYRAVQEIARKAGLVK